VNKHSHKYNLIRRILITLVSIAAGLLPMLMPQWMTSLAAYGYKLQPYSVAIFNPETKNLFLNEIFIPFKDEFGNKNLGYGKFEASMTHKGNSVFELEASSLSFISKSSSYDSTYNMFYDPTTKYIDIPCVKAETSMTIGTITVPVDTVWYRDVKLKQKNSSSLLFNIKNANQSGNACL